MKSSGFMRSLSLVGPGLRRCGEDIRSQEAVRGRREVARIVAKFPTYLDAALAIGVSADTISNWVTTNPKYARPCPLECYRALRRAVGENPDEAIPESRRSA